MALRAIRNIFVSLCLIVPLAGQEASSKDKIKSIQSLVKQGSPAAADDLGKYLSDPDLDVRREAVQGLTTLSGIQSLTPLTSALADADEEIMIRATDGLVNFYNPGYVKFGISGSLKRAGTGLKGKFVDVNDRVIEPWVEVRPEVIDALGKLVANGSLSVTTRANAARALGILRGRAAAPALVDSLRSKESELIYESLVSLRKLGDMANGPAVGFLALDLDEKVQMAAIETAGILRAKEAQPMLREAFARTKSSKVRAAALGSMAMAPDEENRPMFEANLQSREEGLRTASAEGLGRLGNKSDSPRLVKAFSDERSMKPRLGLAFALVMLGHREMTEFGPLRYLVNTLNSSAYRGIASAYLIESARHGEVREALYPVMPARNADEKMELARIFGLSGDAATVPILETLAKDTDVRVGQAATRALQTLRARL